MKFDYLKVNDFCSRKNSTGRIKKGARLDFCQVYNQPRINVQNTQGILAYKQQNELGNPT